MFNSMDTCRVFDAEEGRTHPNFSLSVWILMIWHEIGNFRAMVYW